MATPTICQSPAIVNLSFVPGDTLSFDINLKDANLDPINITGFTIDAYIQTDSGQNDFTVTIVDAILGQTHIQMGSDASILITPEAEWFYKITDTQSKTYTYLMGNVNLQQL